MKKFLLANILAAVGALGCVDITVENIATPSAACLGQDIAPQTPLDLKNTGTQNVDRFFHVAWYLSNDKEFDAEDRLLVGGRDQVHELPAGQVRAVNLGVNIIPEGASLGGQYLLTIVDEGAQIAEANEADNIVASPIEIHPAGTPTCSRVTTDIRIDARALSAPSLILAGVGTFETTVPHDVDLPPGDYALLYAAGAGTPSIQFSVTPAGLISYAPELEPLLDGAGTRTLVVKGVTFDMNATALSVPFVSVLGINGAVATNVVQTFTVIPGPHRIAYGAGAGVPSVDFQVDIMGHVQFDGALDPILSGRGTSTLVINGVTFNIDATALSVPYVSVLGINGAVETNVVQTFTVIPGPHRIAYGAGAGVPSVDFQVDIMGHVQFDAALDPILSGRGTSTLVINGVTFHIDATALSVPYVSVLGINGAVVTNVVQTFTVIPGPHRIAYGAGAGVPSVDFQVDIMGHVQFEPALDPILSGRGTSTLVINGVTFNVDATALSVPYVSVLGINGAVATNVVQTFTVIPGPHRIAYGAGAGVPSVDFQVDIMGHVQFEAALDPILSGRGTSTLVINGVTFHIDATALSVPYVSVLGINGAVATNVVQTFTVIPGPHRIAYGAGAGVQSVDFRVDIMGHVQFEAALDPILSGRGTSTLVVTDVE